MWKEYGKQHILDKALHQKPVNLQGGHYPEKQTRGQRLLWRSQSDWQLKAPELCSMEVVKQMTAKSLSNTILETEQACASMFSGLMKAKFFIYALAQSVTFG